MDRQFLAELMPSGILVRNLIVKVECEPLWSRDGELSWEEFARVFQMEAERTHGAEARLKRDAGESAKDEMARVNRITRYALRQFLDESGQVIRTQLVTSLLHSVLRDGVPDTLTHALVFHETQPQFGLGGLMNPSVERSKYSFVAEVVLPDSPDVLDEAYRDTNAIEAPWHPTGLIRSTSVGDVIVLAPNNGDEASAHQVLAAGFGEVQFV